MVVPKDKYSHWRYLWHGITGLIYLVIAVAFLSAPTSKFETLVLAGLVEMYVTVNFNFVLMGYQRDLDAHTGLKRFEVLAGAAKGISNDDHAMITEHEEELVISLRDSGPALLMKSIANFAVGTYALFKIVQALFF